jgi:hypothetical protein
VENMLNQGRMLATGVKNLALQVRQWCSSNKENLRLYVFLTSIEVCVLGIVLGALGALTPVIAAIGSGLAVLVGLVAGTLAIPGNPFIGLWQRTRRLLVVSVSIATSIIILGGYLLLSLSSRNMQPGSLSRTGAPRIDPYIHKGMLVLDDPLNGSPNTYKWQTTNGFIVNGIDTGSCNFKEQSYQIITLVQQYQTFYCWSQARLFRDFVYQIDITLINNTGGGIIFRLNRGDFFYFGINSFNEYVLTEVTGGQVKPLIADRKSPAIRPGLGQMNTLAVIADGTKISLYINKKSITWTDVNNEEEGYIGAAVVSSTQTPGQVNYTNAEVWSLDQS